MMEVYLFINPVGSVCLRTEEQLLDYVENENKKVQFRFIPLLNLQTISDIMERESLPKTDIAVRNQLSEMIYSATLDFKAAQLQGRKKGRRFLLTLQRLVADEHVPYSLALSEQIFEELGGDIAMFREDRQSDFVKEAFLADQQIARDMGVTQHPSAVVYNYTCNQDFGVLIEHCLSAEEIKWLCTTNSDYYNQLLKTGCHQHHQKLPAHPNYLQLL